MAAKDQTKSSAPDADKLCAVGHVSSLHIFPIKSCRRMDVNSISCTDIGAYLPEHDLYDRFFMVIKAAGFKATMREFPQMALISVSISEGQLCLQAPGMPTINLPCKVEKTDSSVLHKVDIYGQDTYGIDCGQEANEWISNFLGKPNMRLLFFDPTTQKRPAKGGYFGKVGIDVPDNAQLSFYDASPFLLMSEASVKLLNTYMKAPVSIHRFRPNIVVSGCDANSEDFWDRVQIGDAVFKSVTHNPRCVLTTVDPETGMQDPDMEPLRTLRSFRPVSKNESKSPMLGLFMILEKEGKIKVGDTVYASRKSPEWK